MRRIFFICISILFSVAVFAQPTAKELYDAARKLMMQGDYTNAQLSLDKALQLSPGNYEMLKDKVYLHFLQRDFTGALETGKPLTDRPDGDFQAFQLVGMVYKEIADYKECEKLYKKGIKKFPASGVLYSEYGDLMMVLNNSEEAINQWEAGIKADPNHSSNYYNATRYYTQKENLFWVLIYGETFLNIESYTTRSPEVKKVLLEAYNRLLKPGTMDAMQTGSTFQQAVITEMRKTPPSITTPVTPDNLMAIRTRFILNWFETDKKMPFALFDYHRFLMKEGMFEAYNQWIFGPAASAANYQVWQETNAAQVNRFKDYQRSNLFKIPAGQYYKAK
jgi:tetratricopeptide (TPR) repeat protein